MFPLKEAVPAPKEYADKTKFSQRKKDSYRKKAGEGRQVYRQWVDQVLEAITESEVGIAIITLKRSDYQSHLRTVGSQYASAIRKYAREERQADLQTHLRLNLPDSVDLCIRIRPPEESTPLPPA